MRDLADELRSEIDASHARLRTFTEGDAGERRAAGKWTRKEILGHLIDSATNNHQRFVRAQFADPFMWPGYEQEEWVLVNGYGGRTWNELLELWAAMNRHIAHVIEHVPAGKLRTRCVIGSGDAVTLEWLMRDYLDHMRHHLAQIVAPTS